MKQDYIVVHERDYLGDFVSQVNIRLNAGYVLIGGIAVDGDGYYQAMVKVVYDIQNLRQMYQTHPGKLKEIEV